MAQGNYMQWSDLKVWKQAHTLVLEIYSITSSFPRSEIYGITNQLRRASSSVAANIVEGQARNSTKDYINFLYTSRGSLEETRYFLLLSRDLNYVSSETYNKIEAISLTVSKMLNGLIASLKA
jgi:four helix bundle protein